MRVLVTGAGGYVGGAVVGALANAGHEPIALVHNSRGRVPADVEVRSADLIRPDSLMGALADVEAVCHLASLTRARESAAEPVRYFEVNVAGTVALLAAMEQTGVRQLVFASTGAIYGSPDVQPMAEDLPDDPPHPYAASKAAAESVIGWQARTGKLAAVVLRLFNVAGRGDPDPTRIIPRVLAVAAGRTERLEVNGDGTAVRDFLHIDDAAEALVAALDHGSASGELSRFNIGSGHGASVMDVVAVAERLTGRSIPVVHRPPAAEAARLVADPSLAAARLEWKPRRSDLDRIVLDEWRSMKHDE